MKKIAWLIIVLFLTLFVVKSLNTVYQDPARTLPWSQHDISQARSSYQILDNGQIEINITHVPLQDISPQMVAWFYQHLPVSKVKINDKTYPWYHIFHHSEHGVIEVREAANNGEVGMHLNALIHRKEWFGSFVSQGSGRIIEFANSHMRVKPEALGLHFGDITHSYQQEDDVTIYSLNAKIGADIPVFGAIINYFIRQFMFTDAMLEQWLRHQKEEVANLNQFLPALYQAPKINGVYDLTKVAGER